MKSKTVLTAILMLLVSLGQLLHAAEPNPYEPIGAPANPKVAARWNKYHDYAEVTALLQQMAKTHGDRCRLQSLGSTYGGREMWLLTVATCPAEKELERPAFWIDGAIHANEIQATEVALYTAWYLLEMYGRSELVTKLMDERVFYFAPMMSPDSRDAHMHEPNSTNSPRSGQRPIDDDRDGLVDEDKPDDLDGDGHITQMRIRDPHGRWKPNAEYPELMDLAPAGEQGSFTLLGTEGIDNDGDGKVNEDGDGFYDPNRDWPWNWQPRYVQTGAYRYPFSIYENRVVGEFILAHPNIAGAQSYHNAGGMILRGPGVPGDKFASADIAVFDELGKKGELMLPGYRYMETGRDLYTVYGGEIDFFYAIHGTLCFTNELFTPFNYFRQKSGGGFFGKAEERHQADRYLLLGEGFVPWHEVEHPTYGKVEVGGQKKNWMRQPPSFLLEEECHRNMAFTLYHADQMPQIGIAEIKTKKLDGGLTEVTAAIVNGKLVPTRIAFDVSHKLNAPDRISITGKKLQVRAAWTSASPVFEQPSEQKRHPAEVHLDSVPGMAARYVRWLVEGAGPIEISAVSVKAGRVKKSAEVPAK